MTCVVFSIKDFPQSRNKAFNYTCDNYVESKSELFSFGIELDLV